MGRGERESGACLAPPYKVRALLGCVSGAEDTPGSRNVVVVTVTLVWICHVLTIHACSSGVVLHGV